MWNANTPPPGYTPNVSDTSQAPGASRGLLTLIKEYLGGWLGPRLGASTNAGVQVAAEQVHSGPSMVVLPWFLPYFDDYTGETPQARAAYRRMFADPNVKSALLGKLLAVGALDLKIRPAEKKNPLDEEVAEFVKWTLTERVKDGFPGMVWSILSGGLVDGYSVCEKVFEQEEGGEFDKFWPLVAVKPKDVGNDLVLQTDSYRNVVSVMGLRYNAGQYFSPARFLIWRHLPLYDTPTGMSDLRAVYSRYWLLDTVLKLRGVNAEKRAIPFLMGTYTNPSQQRSLENTLALVKSQSWVTVPEGVKVEALNIAGSSDAIFEGFIRDLKHDIFMGIQGAILQALEGTVADGRGNSQVHRSTADLLVWYLAQSLQTLLNDRTNGLIKDIVDLNYVVNRYPRATLSAVDVGEMTAEADLDSKLFAMGVELSKEDMYERYNRVPPLSPEDALKKDAGGMPGMPGPGGPGGGGLPPGGPPGLGDGDPMGGDEDLDGELDDDGLFDEQDMFTAPMRQFAEWDESKHPRAEDGRFGKRSGGDSGVSKPSPATKQGRRKIARALRLAVRRGNTDAPGETTEQCINAAHVLKEVYPEAEIWSGIYGDDPHTIAKLNGRFIDVTADQFGGAKVAIMKRLPALHDGEYRLYRLDNDQQPRINVWNKKILSEFKALLAEEEPSKHAEGKWEESKHPRGKGGRFGRGSSGAQAKKKAKRNAARREAGGGSVDHTSGPSPRKSLLRAAGGQVMATIRKAKHKVEDVEHVVGEYLAHGVDRQIERLPAGVRQGVAATWWMTKLGTKAAFVTYTTGQKLAEEVAKESGATPEQTARIKAICTAVDIAGAKAVPVALGAVGLGAAALPGSFIPAGSAAYLAYSTARRPLAVLRAARNVVKGMAETLLSKFDEDEHCADLARLAESVIEAGDRGDWYAALVCAALDEVDSLAEALDIADEAMGDVEDTDEPTDMEDFAEGPDEDTVTLAMIYLAAELKKGTISQQQYDSAVEKLGPGPEEFAEEDWGQQATRTGGVKWIHRTTGRVVYGKENPGKSKRKPAGEKGPEGGAAPAGGKAPTKPEAKAAPEAKEKAPAKEKPAPRGKGKPQYLSVDDARKAIEAGGDAETLGGVLASLHKDDLNALKKEWKLKVGGDKANQAKALARQVLGAGGQAKPTQEPAAKPEPAKAEAAKPTPSPAPEPTQESSGLDMANLGGGEDLPAIPKWESRQGTRPATPAPAKAKPAPKVKPPKQAPQPTDDEGFDMGGGLELGGGDEPAGKPAMTKEKGLDFLRKSAQQGDDSRHQGYVDNSTAQKLVGAYDLYKDGGELKPLDGFDYLGSGKISRSQFPDDESWQAAQEIASELFSAYSDDQVKEAFGGGKNPSGTFKTRAGGPLVFPDSMEQNAPAYTKFLRERMGAVSQTEDATSKKSGGGSPVAGPKEGDRDANGLVLRGGRWRREEEPAKGTPAYKALLKAIDAAGFEFDSLDEIDGLDAASKQRLADSLARAKKAGGDASGIDWLAGKLPPPKDAAPPPAAKPSPAKSPATGGRDRPPEGAKYGGATDLPQGFTVKTVTPSGVPVAANRLGDLHTAVPADMAKARALAAGIKSAARYQPFYNGLVPMGIVADHIRKLHPDATLADVYSALKAVEQGPTRVFDMYPLNEVHDLGAKDNLPLPDGASGREDGGIWSDGRLKYFVNFRHPENLDKALADSASTPAEKTLGDALRPSWAPDDYRAPEGTAKVSPKAEASALQHISEFKQQNPLNNISFDVLYKKLNTEHPMSPEQFKTLMLDLYARGDIKLHPFTRPKHEMPDPKLAAQRDWEDKYYAQPVNKKGTGFAEGDWDESKHPRAEDGKFGSGGGGGGGGGSKASDEVRAAARAARIEDRKGRGETREQERARITQEKEKRAKVGEAKAAVASQVDQIADMANSMGNLAWQSKAVDKVHNLLYEAVEDRAGSGLDARDKGLADRARDFRALHAAATAALENYKRPKPGSDAAEDYDKLTAFLAEVQLSARKGMELVQAVKGGAGAAPGEKPAAPAKEKGPLPESGSDTLPAEWRDRLSAMAGKNGLDFDTLDQSIADLTSQAASAKGPAKKKLETTLKTARGIAHDRDALRKQHAPK